MASSHIPTFEDVDKHIQSVDLTEFQVGGKHHPKGIALSPSDVCAAYKMVKPILVLVAGIPLIPKKWRDAINVFIGVVDKICP